MLVCSVVLRPQRYTIADEIFEAASASDTPSLGTVLASLSDNPGTAREYLDAFIGSRIPEAANATATVDALSAHPAAILEEISAAIAAQDAVLDAATDWATWDPGAVSNVTLSGGNLIATNTAKAPVNQGASVAAADGKTTGKYYFEATFISFTGGGNTGVGIGTTTSTYSGLGGSATTGNNGLHAGTIWANGASTGITLGLYGDAQVAGIAADLVNRKIWFRRSSGNWNNSGTANPATNVGGITIPAGTMVPFVTFGGSGGAINNVVAANFGGSAFSGAVPSGFTPGWPLGGASTLAISGTPVTTATVGVAFAGFTVTATGGTPPYTYSVASGTLPAGITLNSSSGVVSGTPTTAGTYAAILLRATDAASAIANLASFTITVAAPPPPLDAVASVTGAWSLGRNMLTSFGAGTRYTKSGTAILTLEDQSGNNRDLNAGGGSPTEATAFPTSVLCADFDGVNDILIGPALSAFIAAGSGALVVSVIIDAVSLNNGSSSAYLNHGIFGDSGQYTGLFAASAAGLTFQAFNWDGSADTASITGTVGTAYVVMWRHHGGNLYVSINGGTETTVASGNTTVLGNSFCLGGVTNYCNCKIAEVFATSDGSQTTALAAAIASMKTYVGA